MRSDVKYKSFAHWFSYHWGWLLAAAVLALLLVHGYLTRSRTPQPDYTVSWVGSTALSEAEEAAVSAAVVRAGADQNGDGQVTAAVNQYVIDFTLNPDSPGYADSYAGLLKLTAQVQAGDYYLYLAEDPERLQSATGLFQYLDGTIPSGADGYECANWEQMCFPWQPEGLEHQGWLGRRALFGKDDARTLFPGSDALFAALAAG